MQGITTLYTQQQNRMVEQKIWKIVKMARSLLNAKGLPNKF